MKKILTFCLLAFVALNTVADDAYVNPLKEASAIFNFPDAYQYAPRKDMKSVWQKTLGVKLPKLQGKYGAKVADMLLAYPKSGGVFLTDLQGTPLTKEYSKIYEPRNGYMVAKNMGRGFDLLDMNGKVVCSSPEGIKSAAKIVTEETWFLQKDDGKYIFVSTDGTVKSGEYDDVWPYHNGMAIVQQNERLGLLSHDSLVAPCKFRGIEFNYEYPYAWASLEKDTFCLLNMQEAICIEKFYNQDLRDDFPALKLRLRAFFDNAEREQIRKTKQAGVDVANKVASIKEEYKQMIEKQEASIDDKMASMNIPKAENVGRKMVGCGNISVVAGLAVASSMSNSWGFVTLDGRMLNRTFVFADEETANRALAMLAQNGRRATDYDIDCVMRSSMPYVNKGSLYDTLDESFWTY